MLFIEQVAPYPRFCAQKSSCRICPKNQPFGFPSGQILRNFGLLGILGRIGSIGGSSKMCIEIVDSKWIPVMKCMRYSWCYICVFPSNVMCEGPPVDIQPWFSNSDDILLGMSWTPTSYIRQHAVSNIWKMSNMYIYLCMYIFLYLYTYTFTYTCLW